jgi:hypothetical protein
MGRIKEFYTAESWPDLLRKVVSDDPTDIHKKNLRARLSYDPNFRENFCDWIKSLRKNPNEPLEVKKT